MPSLDLLYITSISQAYFLKLSNLKLHFNMVIVIKAKRFEIAEIIKVLGVNDRKSNIKVIRIIDKTGVSKFSRTKTLVHILLVTLFKKPKAIGYFNFYDICSSVLYVFNEKADCYLIDDGAATISAQIDYISKGVFFYPSRITCLNRYFACIQNKRSNIKPPTLVSQFSLNRYILPNQEVIRYKLATLKNKNINDNLAGIVGSPYSEFGLLTLTQELDYLRIVKNLSKGNNLIYIPHPRDSREKLDAIAQIPIEVTEIRSPIEQEYLSGSKYLPAILYGGYSTALYSLKSQFSELEVHAINLSRIIRKNSRGSINNVTLNGIYSELECIGVILHDI